VIQNVSIRHFKSIRQLDFSCKRVNLFIGEPNTGKSNLLEALGLFSTRYIKRMGDFVRMKDMTNLFFDNNTTERIEVKLNDGSLIVSIGDDEAGSKYFYLGSYKSLEGEEDEFFFSHSFSINGVIEEKDAYPLGPKEAAFDFIRFYKFNPLDAFSYEWSRFLSTPFGNNLFDMLLTHKPLREIVAGIIKEKGYRLNLETGSKEIKLLREVEDVVYTYPYQTISDTLQRIIFYLAAIETNKNSALILEEPEANTFPFYTKYLAETIARDDSNQYFIATHNPYLLLSLVEKMKTSEVGVFITYQENYETRLRPLSEEELSELLDLNTDVFFKFDKFLSK
jgi:AAA15 family ATPase/GTPase